MLTANAEHHPVKSCMQQRGPTLALDQRGKRSIVLIELADVDIGRMAAIRTTAVA